ncbi:DUF3253 domain-containing protein [Kibdelosporangium phytohabitans]|uniref:S-adenosylmethionine tRNA ribosyltransferase n=1 Tax=Kibdelosporangium phytohabitans TaxID=860235 RepID=A0A0N9I762_9PSEU|nr:DUF3253 domain-containing protein [Kibdelosporangium phytohabitans]ALG10592.1 hypothetical protein AOZ06_30145 [Kibdelosporangium phytohabitans]MBE1461701.1 hypothetical protein [Kibdelosporangium phytohabitans]
MPHPRRQLERIRDGDGPGADQARIAMTAEARPEQLRAAILALVHARGADSSICPSDAARAVAGDWRPLMPEAVDLARNLARSGAVQLTQRDRLLGPDDEWQGPIRIRLPRRSDG